jgi:hypothetical protein
MIEWANSLEDAKQRATSSRRHVLIDFSKEH